MPKINWISYIGSLYQVLKRTGCMCTVARIEKIHNIPQTIRNKKRERGERWGGLFNLVLSWTTALWYLQLVPDLLIPLVTLHLFYSHLDYTLGTWNTMLNTRPSSFGLPPWILGFFFLCWVLFVDFVNHILISWLTAVEDGACALIPRYQLFVTGNISNYLLS